MKILISNEGFTAHYYERLGLARALNSAGHDVAIWDCVNKPAIDIFEEYEPDIFIGQTYNLNRPLATAIKERPHLKVAMKASDWSSFTDSLSKMDYPILDAKSTEVNAVLELNREIGQPAFLFIHYHPETIATTHEYWLQSGLNVYSNMNAADVFNFTNGKVMDEFTCDIAFCGGYWGYKSKILDKWMLPLCEKDYKIKIYGNQPWPVYQYCGFLQDEYVKHALASATICPNLHEPHSQAFGYDIVERPFKLLSNKCFVISDYVAGLEQLIPEGIVYARSPEEFLSLIEFYLNHPDERWYYIENGFNEVIKNHTYFDRAADLFTHFGYDEFALGMKKVKEEVIRGLNII